MADDNPFRYFTVTRLTTLQETIMQAIEDILTTGASYNINGRSFTGANLGELQDLLGQVSDALDTANGKVGNPSVAQAIVRGGPSLYGYGDVNRV